MLFLAQHPYYINLCIVIVLFAWLARVNTISDQLLVLFWYTTLHYFYGWLPFLMSSDYNQAGWLIWFTQNDQHYLITWLGVAFLVLFFVLFFIKNRTLFNKQSFIRYTLSKEVVVTFSVGLAWLLYNVYLYFSNEIVFSNNTVSFVLYYTLLLGLCLVWGYYFRLMPLSFKERTRISIHIMLVGGIAVSFIVGGLIFGDYRFYPRFYVYLLNANSFAFYCGLLSFIIYQLALKDGVNKYHIFGLVFFAIGVFYSGSRSVFIMVTLTNGLGFLLMFFCVVAQKRKILLVCVMLFYFVFFSLFAVPFIVKIFLPAVNNNFTLVTTYQTNRVIAAMNILAKLAVGTGNQDNKAISSIGNSLNKIVTYFHLFKDVEEQARFNRASLMSIDGRFGVQGYDNTYIFIAKKLSWTSLYILTFSLFVFLWSGLYRLFKKQNIEHMFGILLLLYCCLSAAIMHLFSLFPLLLYVAAILALQIREI